MNRWCSWLNVAAALQPIEIKDEALQSQATEISDESRKEIENNAAKLRDLKQELLLRMYERDQRYIRVSIVLLLLNLSIICRIHFKDISFISLLLLFMTDHFFSTHFFLIYCRIQKLFFEEQKYELAGVMGSSFAPKVR